MKTKHVIAAAAAVGGLALAAGPVFAATHAEQMKPVPRAAATSHHAGTQVAQAGKQYNKSEKHENENDAPGDAGDQGEE